MAFDFNQYESFARSFAECNHEVGLRNSVSRGYYSYYHRIKDFFRIPKKVYKRHEELISDLRNDDRLIKGPWLAQSMQVMKEQREQADYYIENHPGKEKIVFNKAGVERFWIRYNNALETLSKESLEE